MSAQEYTRQETQSEASYPRNPIQLIAIINTRSGAIA